MFVFYHCCRIVAFRGSYLPCCRLPLCFPEPLSRPYFHIWRISQYFRRTRKLDNIVNIPKGETLQGGISVAVPLCCVRSFSVRVILLRCHFVSFTYSSVTWEGCIPDSDLF